MLYLDYNNKIQDKQNLIINLFRIIMKQKSKNIFTDWNT